MKHKLTIGIVIRSIIFWILAAGVLPFYCILAGLIIPLSSRTRHRIMTTAPVYWDFLLQKIGGITYTVRGKENIPTDPAIFAGNHQSAWETVVLNRVLPPCVWIMKRELFKIPFFGWGLRGISAIAINRTKGEDSLNQVIEQGKQRFALGYWIIMFPEGTRLKPKSRKPFKYGAAKLAQSLDVPIVPFAHNAGYCLPRNSVWLYPGHIDVIIGKPIYPDSDDPVKYTEKIQTWVHAQLNTIGS